LIICLAFSEIERSSRQAEQSFSHHSNIGEIGNDLNEVKTLAGLEENPFRNPICPMPATC